ncbi:hypothetical protein BJ508DRAFT_411592 [Ascobolus immersus RN42]|uniref:Uncharacterized protein n=1 Tax=Ascobolus immersus RN42 TaxID=1160509 RepID=A0A3N4IK04_ASCIM|nr:hypothetical protein BJ508DRAFT_411592 [Ascobolus immersus RN42]
MMRALRSLPLLILLIQLLAVAEWLIGKAGRCREIRFVIELLTLQGECTRAEGDVCD